MGTKPCAWKLGFFPQKAAVITKMVIQETLPIGLRKDDGSLRIQRGVREGVATGSTHLGLLPLSWRRCCCTRVRGRQVPGGTPRACTQHCVHGLCQCHLSRQRPKSEIKLRQTQKVLPNWGCFEPTAKQLLLFKGVLIEGN